MRLNQHGYALAEHVRNLLEEFDRTHLVINSDSQSEVLRLGTVSTAMVSFLPPSLKTLKDQNPDFKISVCADISVTLANLLVEDKLDAAILNKPDIMHSRFIWHEILCEPLIVIAPETYHGDTYLELITNNPFIWFDRNTWEGQIIEAHIQQCRLNINSSIEMDSLDAIALMVANGIGVSVVPQSTLDAANHEKVKTIAFGDPPIFRVLGMLSKKMAGKSPSIETMVNALRHQIKNSAQSSYETSPAPIAKIQAYWGYDQRQLKNENMPNTLTTKDFTVSNKTSSK